MLGTARSARVQFRPNVQSSSRPKAATMTSCSKPTSHKRACRKLAKRKRAKCGASSERSWISRSRNVRGTTGAKSWRTLKQTNRSKAQTLRRYMVPLIALCNLAIDEGKHAGINPFANCVPDREDADERDAFTDDDMKLIRANLHRLDKADQLLVRVLATTGMRRGEAFEIDHEKTKNGIRYCEVGSKTPQSRRRVPFPKYLLPHLPRRITDPLFTGRMDNAGKRLRAWLGEIGINDADKAPMHSFRHRAAQRMRAANIPEDVREAIGGWANGKGKKISRKYGNKHGAGYPISMLREAIDKIGM